MLPALSLIYEMPEADLMKQPPRNPRKDKMVDLKLFLHAYLYLGVLESVFAFIMYFWYMHSVGGFTPGDLILAFNKWGDNYKGHTLAELHEILYGAQSCFFICLVTMQFGNLLSTRTRTLSFFQQLPFKGESRNLRVFGAILGSLSMMLLLIEVPFFQTIFNVRSPPIQFWLLPWVFAAFLFCIDEIRKLVLRKYMK